MLQSELFPKLEQSGNALSAEHRRIAAALAMLPLERFVPLSRGWMGRPAKDRLAMARAFVAKAVLNLSTTRQLIERLRLDGSLLGICGWSKEEELPHESTFSRAFAEFAEAQLGQFTHETLIRETQSGRVIGHIARDSTAIAARERFPETPKQKRAKGQRVKSKAERPSLKGRTFRKLSRNQRRKEQTAKTATAQQKDLSAEEILKKLPQQCSIGAKASAHGTMYWRGYKLHLDVADGQIPITALLTAANVHDAKLAIPMTKLTTARVTYLYELMDAAYDAAAIREHSAQLGHVAIIPEKKRSSGKTQLPHFQKKKPEMEPAKAARFRNRTMVERVYARLKDEFGISKVRVRGPAKVMAHLMFAILALTADQLLRLA
jgi:hypothetical protein